MISNHFLTNFPLIESMQINGDEQNDQQELDSRILNRLDALSFSAWHMFVVLSLGLVWIFDGYQVTLISLYRHQIEEQHSQDIFKSLVSAYQIGGIVGSVVFGISAFIIGRRKIFIITLLVYALGVLLSGMQTGSLLFVFSRFLTGLSVGGEFTAIFTAVDEFLPPSYRGRVNIGIDGTWHLGGTLASILTLLVGQTQHWRLMFLIGWIGIVSLLLMRRNVPQSPRWLLLKGRQQQATEIVAAIQQAVQNNHMMLKQIKSLAGNAQISSRVGKSFCDYIVQIVKLLKEAMTAHTKKFVVSFTLIFVQALFFNLVYYQYPDILAQKYNLNQEKISSYMLPLSVTSFISTLFIGPYFDKIGRRKLLLFTYGLSGILLFISYQIQQLLPRQILVILLFVFASPASSSANLIASQVFPTSSRTIVLFVMFICSMLGGMMGVWFDNYIIASILMILAGVVAFIFCPNSQNKTLEQIQKM